MHPTRREMLRLGLGSSALLACGPTVPLFLARSATALADGPRPPPKGRILVVVQLDGGNDGLNTVVPYRDDEYRKQRPELAIPAARGEEDRRPRRPASVARGVLEAAGAAAAGDRAERGLSQPEPVALREHGDLADGPARPRTRPRPAGWPGRSTVAPARRATRPALHIHESFPLPRSLAGGRQVVPSLARLEQFRRRLGVPAGRRGRRADRGPRSPGQPGPRRARLAAPVRRAVQPDHLCQQRPARAAAAGQHRPPRSTIPTSTAWPGGSA